MKRKNTSRVFKRKIPGNLVVAKGAEKKEEEIPDISQNKSFWAPVRPFTPPQTKAQLTLRLDQDVVDWFRSQGRGYQTHINATLRTYMDHAPKKSPAGRSQ